MICGRFTLREGGKTSMYLFTILSKGGLNFLQLVLGSLQKFWTHKRYAMMKENQHLLLHSHQCSSTPLTIYDSSILKVSFNIIEDLKFCSPMGPKKQAHATKPIKVQ